MSGQTPIAGQWYRQAGKNVEFKITAVDEEAGTVEMQYTDGDLQEVDLDTWRSFDVTPIAARDDSVASTLDDVEPEDLGYEDAGLMDDEWSNPLHDQRLLGDGEDDEGRW